VVLRAGQGEHPFRVVPPSDLSQLRIQNATITINYIAPGTQNTLGDTCLAWPTGSQAAFNYAASIWGSLLNSSVPIKINACWASLEPDVLGHSAPESHHRNFSGAPVANTWYSAALANALSGTDQNDADGLDDDGFNGDVDAEMEIAYNDQGIPWYFGTDGNPSMGQYDFVSVVLHEVCHGLGFAGSMWVYGGQGSWGMEGQPTIYDRFMENGSAQSLLNTSLFPNPSSALAAQLQSNNLYFDGANARAANGGARPKMYAPSTWQPGSSYAHLDEIFNGTANALMTYSLDDGEAVHDPGQVTMGILKDVGWNPMQPAPDLSIVTRVVGGLSLEPGDPITFTLTIANSGDKVASHVVVTDTVPSQVLSPSFASTLAITRTGVLTYVWNVAPLGVGASGVITIYGQLNPGLGSNFSLVNTATVWDPEDRTPGNNTSSVLVGGHRTHLPLVMKRWPPIPDTPTLNAISNPDGDGNYTVSWNAAYLASTYTLQEDDNAGFSSPAVQYTSSGTSWNAVGKAGGTYYYRVKASNSWGDSGWSSVQSASVRPPTVFYSVADASVLQGLPTLNDGNDADMWVGYEHCGNNGIVRGLVRFDLSAIPPGTQIAQATLSLYLTDSCDTGNRTHTVTTYRVANDWGETSVTWNTRPGSAEAYGSSSVSSRTWQRYNFDVTNLVRGWVNSSFPNYGLMLRGPESSGTSSARLGFNTRNEYGTTYDPYISIVYVGMTASEGTVPGVEGISNPTACGVNVKGDELSFCQDASDCGAFEPAERAVCSPN